MTRKNQRVKKIDAEKRMFLDKKQRTDTGLWRHAHSWGPWATAQGSTRTEDLQVIANNFCDEQIRG
jgi:hypothetical protein